MAELGLAELGLFRTCLAELGLRSPSGRRWISIDFGDRYEMDVDLPGSSAERIDVTVHDGVLTIAAAVADRLPIDGSDRIEPRHGEYGVGDFRR